MCLPSTRIEISCTSCTTSNLVDSHETAFCRLCRAQVSHSIHGNWFRLRQLVWFDSTKGNQLYQGTIVSIKYDSNDSTEGPVSGKFLPVRIKYLDTNWSADKYDEFKSFDKLYIEAPGRESRRGDTPTKPPIPATAAVSVTASIHQPTTNPPSKKRRVNQSNGKPVVKTDVKRVENQSSIAVAGQQEVDCAFARLLNDPSQSLLPEEPTAQAVAVATNAAEGGRIIDRYYIRTLHARCFPCQYSPLFSPNCTLTLSHCLIPSHPPFAPRTPHTHP